MTQLRPCSLTSLGWSTQLQAIEEKKKRAALATLDDNCIFSPGRLQC